MSKLDPARDKAVLSFADLDVSGEGVSLASALGRALFLWALDPIMLTNPETGAILDANPAACRVLGLTVDEIRARGRAGLQDPADEDRWLAGVKERARTGSFAGELSMRRGDGTTFPAESTSAVFPVGDRHYAVLIFRDVSDRRALEHQLRGALDEMAQAATMDPLTGILNRRGFLTIGHALEENAHREGLPLVVLTADVDRLKYVNDAYGHAAGDDMLRAVAETMTSTLRTADVVARVGGDEFAVILTGARAPTDAAIAAGRINQRLAERARRQALRYPVTVSIGIASGAPGAEFNLHGLLRDADEAMYAHKREQGRE